MIVMKFGGTSVQDAKAIDRAAQIVQGRLADRPVVVVSAMGDSTDQLIELAKQVCENPPKREMDQLLVTGGAPAMMIGWTSSAAIGTNSSGDARSGLCTHCFTAP